MTSRDFCYWLQGCLELVDPESFDEDQIEIIKRHLALVFKHEIDPSFPKEQQEELIHIHNPDEILRC